jgi:Uma2 family endonuclease
MIGRVRLSIQDPFRLDGLAEPEPDLVIVRRESPEDRHPGPADALLVIEVSDSSIRVDRGRKRRMYARAGIAEYWIVDLNADGIEIYRDSGARGYRSTALAVRGESISPLFAPDFTVDVARVLGEPAAEG